MHLPVLASTVLRGSVSSFRQFLGLCFRHSHESEPIGAMPRSRADMLTLREAATLLAVHPNTVRSQAVRGQLPGPGVSRGWRFLASDRAFTRMRKGMSERQD